MAYDLRGLSKQVEVCLLASPHIALAALAKQLRVERHTIERAVRKATGKSFRQLQAGIISKKSLDLLALEPARSIKEIAFLLGFKSGQAFSRFVRRTCKSPPKELRLAQRAKPATIVT